MSGSPSYLVGQVPCRAVAIVLEAITKVELDAPQHFSNEVNHLSEQVIIPD